MIFLLIVTLLSSSCGLVCASNKYEVQKQNNKPLRKSRCLDNNDWKLMQMSMYKGWWESYSKRTEHLTQRLHNIGVVKLKSIDEKKSK